LRAVEIELPNHDRKILATCSLPWDYQLSISASIVSISISDWPHCYFTILSPQRREAMTKKILYLTTNNPCGRAYGGQLRAFHIGRALAQVARVTLVLGLEDITTPSEIEAAREEFDDVKILHISENSSETPFQYISRHVSLSIGNALKLICTPKERSSFLEWVSEHDLVWSFGLHIPSAIGLDTGESVFLDIDDIPSQKITSQLTRETRWLEKAKLRCQAGIWKRREIRLPSHFCGVGVCSEADRVYLGAYPSIHVIPNGFQKPDALPRRHPALPEKIGFIGTLDYSPNVDGINWFIESVWPRIKGQLPDARLRLVGSGSDQGLMSSGRDVDGLGYVTDPAAEIASWSMMVIPIFVGAGTRVKIAEGFSRKCPIVSTSLGAYGYDVCNGRELLIADTEEAFADACLRVIRHPLEATSMTERAWKTFLEKWTWDSIAPQVWSAAEDCLRRRPVG
jgi:glycosyltransferase involved in cell wall biosynthesis